jgi:CDP-4-dehydro-6-deoxyglucose reductase
MQLRLQLPANDPFATTRASMSSSCCATAAAQLLDGQRPPHTGAPAVELHIRHMPGGKFTDHVFGAMKEKEIQRIEGPFGSFFLREDSDKPIVLLASGTGFAPIKA